MNNLNLIGRYLNNDIALHKRKNCSSFYRYQYEAISVEVQVRGKMSDVVQAHQSEARNDFEKTQTRGNIQT